jgi:hypothetical protein
MTRVELIEEVFALRHRTPGTEEGSRNEPARGGICSLAIPVGTAVYTPGIAFLTISRTVETIFGATFSTTGGLEQFSAFEAFRADVCPHAPGEWPFARPLLQDGYVRDEEMRIVRQDGSVPVVPVSSYLTGPDGGNLVIKDRHITADSRRRCG